MKHKKITYQGYYNKRLWSKGSPRVVKRNHKKTFRNYLRKDLEKTIKELD